MLSDLFYDSANQRLYIVADRSGLEIWDISNESSPYKLDYCFTPGSAFGVYVLGNYAYIADGEAGLRIINVSDPSAPFEASYYDTPGEALGVYVSDSYA